MSYCGLIYLSKITTISCCSYSKLLDIWYVTSNIHAPYVDLLLNPSYPVIKFAIRHNTCACTHTPNPSQLVESGGELTYAT